MHCPTQSVLRTTRKSAVDLYMVQILTFSGDPLFVGHVFSVFIPQQHAQLYYKLNTPQVTRDHTLDSSRWTYPRHHTPHGWLEAQRHTPAREVDWFLFNGASNCILLRPAYCTAAAVVQQYVVVKKVSPPYRKHRCKYDEERRRVQTRAVAIILILYCGGGGACLPKSLVTIPKTAECLTRKVSIGTR